MRRLTGKQVRMSISARLGLALGVFLVAMLLAASAAPAAVLWTPDGVAACTNAETQCDAVSAPDGAGGTIIAWGDDRYSGMTDDDIYAQRLDSSGNVLWADDVDVCRATSNQYDPRIVADGSGGAIITWEDYRNGSCDIYAQRLDADGSVHAGWTGWGEAVCHYDAWTQADPELCSDQLGGAVIAWRDYRNGNNDIFAQLINGDGDRQWTNAADPSHSLDGVPVTEATLDQENPRIVWTTGGNPGPVIAWEDDRDNTTSNLDVYAQKLNPASGAQRWTADGAVVYEDSAGAQAKQESPCLVSDGAGGAIVAWQDTRNTDYDIYVQRLGNLGAQNWGGANGLSVCGAANGQIEPAISAKTEGAYIAWHDMRDDLGDIYVASVLNIGLVSWTTCATDASGTQEVPVLASVDSGVAVAWTHDPSSTSDVYAQFISTLGITVLPDNGFAVCDAAGAQTDLSAVADAGHDPIVTWCDPRTDADGDIYSQKISSDSPTVTSITPNSGTNTGAVSITDLAGTGFDMNGASVVLRKSGETDISATAENVVSSTRITCTANLSGVATGTWDVVVTNDDTRDGTLVGAFTVNAPAPTLASITPASGQSGESVSITNLAGTGFLSGATVRLEKTGETDITASSVSVVSSTRITCTLNLEDAAAGAWNVTVANGDGQSDTLVRAFTIEAAPADTYHPTWYLAEGTTDYGFDTSIQILNPNSTAVTAEVDYQTKSGPKSRADITLAPNSQTILDPRGDIGNTDFSTRVSCKEGKTIAVDRRMTWTGSGAASSEGHTSVGVTEPAKTWYLPEGSSKWGFECWLLIQNPNAASVTCNITYMIEGETERTVTETMPANTRASYSMKDHIGEKDASIRVVGSLPVIPERAMYRNNRREGHDSIGTTAAAYEYFLAEGTTDWGFTTYVLIQNPNANEATVSITYMTRDGAVFQEPFAMPASSRKTVRVNDVLPAKDMSIRVVGDRPIIAERAMYWNNGTGEACHDSIGMTDPHSCFYLPDGRTSGGFETWTLVQNPNAVSISVEITYMTPGGTGNKTVTDTMGPYSRKTYFMADSGIDGTAGIKVASKTAGRKIMVERAMYWNTRGAGTDTIGGCDD